MSNSLCLCCNDYPPVPPVNGLCPDCQDYSALEAARTAQAVADERARWVAICAEKRAALQRIDERHRHRYSTLSHNMPVDWVMADEALSDIIRQGERGSTKTSNESTEDKP